METNRWVRWDRWMRALHLYTGLFLVPWMTVYAVSAFWRYCYAADFRTSTLTDPSSPTT
jgi:hypothetical protein